MEFNTRGGEGPICEFISAVIMHAFHIPFRYLDSEFLQESLARSPQVGRVRTPPPLLVGLVLLSLLFIWRPSKGGRLQQQHVVARKVGKCQFVYTAVSDLYFTTFAGSPDGVLRNQIVSPNLCRSLACLPSNLDTASLAQFS